MLCKKCRQELPNNAIYCHLCGKKQTVTAAKHRKRAHGTGTIRKDSRYKNQYIAIAPSSANGAGRTYIGSYPDMKSAQAALEDYIQHGRPELYNATLEDIYHMWSEIHYKQIKEPAAWLAMWKRYEPIHKIKMADIRTAHFQQFVSAATSKSYADKLKSLALMLCRFAMENDLVNKNYAEFIKLPKFEKTEKAIFTDEQLHILWQHTSDKWVQAILAMIYMGFRVGELTALYPGNVHLAEGYVIGGEKTNAGINRIIPFPSGIPEIAFFFRQWLTEAVPGQTLLGVSVHEFREKHFYGVLSELGMIAAEKVGDKWIFADKHHLTPHSTRHTFASLSVTAGMRPEHLQKIIGHANYATTADIYIHKNVSELSAEMAKLHKPPA